ncbi:MAG: histidinol-phosphate transaminase [Bacteroidales bacterium]
MNNKVNIQSLVRPNIRRLVPYASARDEFTGPARIYLDANENPFNTPLNRYPDPGQRVLKEAIAALKGQPVENLFLGNGSDEGIDLLIRVLCTPGEDNVVTVDPTYGMYGVCADIQDVERKQVLLRPDFSLDADAVVKAVDPRTKIVFLCSPNNPTSNSFDRVAIERIINEVPCIVVVDEAYIDFSRSGGLLPMIPHKPNLVILQTLSKAWGLAGIRLGMVFGHPELIGYLSRIKYPYNINALTLGRALEGLADGDAHDVWVRQILEERENMILKLQSFGMVEQIHPSDANFLLVKMNEPLKVQHFLMDRGIIVRDRSSVPLCEGCLRITVGTPAENLALYEALGAYAQTTQKEQP